MFVFKFEFFLEVFGYNLKLLFGLFRRRTSDSQGISVGSGRGTDGNVLAQSLWRNVVNFIGGMIDDARGDGNILKTVSCLLVLASGLPLGKAALRDFALDHEIHAGGVSGWKQVVGGPVSQAAKHGCDDNDQQQILPDQLGQLF